MRLKRPKIEVPIDRRWKPSVRRMWSRLIVQIPQYSAAVNVLFISNANRNKSITHTHTHMRTHARAHTHTHVRAVSVCMVNSDLYVNNPQNDRFSPRRLQTRHGYNQSLYTCIIIIIITSLCVLPQIFSVHAPFHTHNYHTGTFRYHRSHGCHVASLCCGKA